MEATIEELAGFKNHAQITATRGKRTKRHRPPSPPAAGSTTSSFSAGDDCSSIPTFSDEEEDTANCLILLAQGTAAAAGEGLPERLSDRRLVAAVEGGGDRAAFYIYECKTCNRTFPSFQALGGHRAGHKRPRISSDATSSGEEEEKSEPQPVPQQTSTQKATNGGGKVHECLICGSEFSSGQALGGHMRRHRAPVPVTSDRRSNDGISGDPKRALPLDLNLPPAPEDDHGVPKFHQLSTNPQHLVFAAPTLVDCHY